MFIILIYDANEKRVNKFFKICKAYLTHIQRSVFEGDLTEAQLLVLKDKLLKVLNKEEDSLIIYKFRSKKYFDRETIGIEKPSHEDIFII